MMDIQEEKYRRRQYISMYIDRYALSFFAIAFIQLAFGPYRSLDLTGIKFYICLLNAMLFVAFWHWNSIGRLINFIRFKKEVPDDFKSWP